MEPDFDLFGFNIRQNWTFSNQLLPAQRTRFRTLSINPFQCFDLLSCVTDIFSSIHMLVNTPTATFSVLLYHHSHFCSNPNPVHPQFYKTKPVYSKRYHGEMKTVSSEQKEKPIATLSFLFSLKTVQ